MDQIGVNPNVSVDCVVFGFLNDKLHVLLIEQQNTGHSRAQFALPGDLVLENESLDEAAARVLNELTQLSGVFLHQFYTFGHPDRVKNVKDLAWLQSYRKQPQARVITVAYYALVPVEKFSPAASSFAAKVFWKEIKELPELAFDHNQIVDAGLASLQLAFANRNIGLELLPNKFTLHQIQVLHETILDKKLDKRNFRKKMLKEGLIVPLNEKQVGVLHKPGQLFALNLEQLKANYQFKDFFSQIP